MLMGEFVFSPLVLFVFYFFIWNTFGITIHIISNSSISHLHLNLFTKYVAMFSIMLISQCKLQSECFVQRLCSLLEFQQDHSLSMALSPGWIQGSQCPLKDPDYPVEALGTFVLAFRAYQLVYLKESGHVIL